VAAGARSPVSGEGDRSGIGAVEKKWYRSCGKEVLSELWKRSVIGAVEKKWYRSCGKEVLSELWKRSVIGTVEKKCYPGVPVVVEKWS